VVYSQGGAQVLLLLKIYRRDSFTSDHLVVLLQFAQLSSQFSFVRTLLADHFGHIFDSSLYPVDCGLQSMMFVGDG
jgi:hypothetical protein